MDAIARKTETNMRGGALAPVAGKAHLSITAATAHAACTTAMDIGADAILTVSQAGITAQMVSRFRPDTLIVALLLDEQVQRQMASTGASSRSPCRAQAAVMSWSTSPSGRRSRRGLCAGATSWS